MFGIEYARTPRRRQGRLGDNLAPGRTVICWNSRFMDM
jgi:hypothetical protein